MSKNDASSTRRRLLLRCVSSPDSHSRHPMTLKLSMTCGPYDRARALIDGSVNPEGIELNVNVNDDDVDRQRRAARGEFDVCEFFTGTYIADLPFKKIGFTAIPIF